MGLLQSNVAAENINASAIQMLRGALMDELGATNLYEELIKEIPQYKDVFERNYKEAGWNISKWWLNNYKKPLPTYAANYDYLKDWLDVRNDWMTVHFNPFGEDYKIGDVNGDKSIDVFDATLVQKYIVENAELTGEQKIIADVNNDNTVDALDATEIQKYSSDMLSKFKRVI